ncbi:Uncharacterised protein [Vibrio cholerae]|nr:Uncharacterised protein [Vibrio cholerae]
MRAKISSSSSSSSSNMIWPSKMASFSSPKVSSAFCLITSNCAEDLSRAV